MCETLHLKAEDFICADPRLCGDEFALNRMAQSIAGIGLIYCNMLILKKNHSKSFFQFMERIYISNYSKCLV